MKRVKTCFGRYGERNCISFLCEDKNKCSKCYWEWYNLRKERKLREKIVDFIENYCKKNKLKMQDLRRMKRGENGN